MLSHTISDTASNLMIAAKDAVESNKSLRDNTNLSNTALAQSQIAGTVTQGNLTSAMAQLMAYQAAKEAAEAYEGEITRRETLTGRVASHQRDELVYDAHKAGIVARRQTLRDGMLFAVIFHPEAPGAIEVLLDAGADPMAQNASEPRRSSTNHLNPIDCVELPDGIKSTFSY